MVYPDTTVTSWKDWITVSWLDLVGKVNQCHCVFM